MRLLYHILVSMLFMPSVLQANLIRLEMIQEEDTIYPVSGYVLRTGWKYHSGDNLEWANPDVDETGWQDLEMAMGKDLFSTLEWDGIGWFRYHFELGEEIGDVPLVLFVAQLGASEIYLDGKLIGAFGDVAGDGQTERLYLSDNLLSFISLSKLNPGSHVLAVRFSNQISISNLLYRMPVGFEMCIAEREYGVALRGWIIRSLTLQQMLFWVPLSMALLHLLLYLFHRSDREDLYYALLALSLAGMIYTPMNLAFVHDVVPYVLSLVGFKLSLALSGIFGLWFVQHFFKGGITPYYKFVVVLGALLCLFSTVLDIGYYFFFLLLTFPVSVQIIFRAFCQKRKGAMLVGMGLLIFIAGCILQIANEWGLVSRGIVFFSYIYGSIALVLSMSFYLARIFAKTHHNLQSQLQQVKELSALALAQEREKKRLDMQAQEEEERRKLLEADNARKAKALEEARKRQQILVELRETHEALETTQEKLVQSEKMASLGNLVAGIAHEINTPVGAINSMHDTLMRAMDRLRTVLDTEFGDSLQQDRNVKTALQVIRDANRVIATGAERVTEIVRSLRSFARLDDAERKEADLHEGIENTLTLIHHDLKNRIELVKDYGQLPLLLCFPSRLNQVFLNLLVNAAQAIEGKGTITIITQTVGEHIEISISDTGKGIPSENLARIFDPGFTTKGVGVGTGLGLSICYQIIEDHGGEIQVQSKEGEGTTFKIILPITTENG